ncbi:MAG: hypothetical protein OZ913_00245 [Ignavibacteriaceae bacterium]|jgi:hypothetical protein|nr:MAG: hypothetical protein EDM69_04350 [Chlorobiota bacterium]KXK04943.1 MAG: hypothetical protein UZ04_CHB001000831 [Chlorobi bacterium OLB4]MBV6397759.1 hypothetical protein [Ignavibacteria bacterium]MCC6885538.1 hypothetical protein [Ignavibacteriales bacterium]MCE7952890.1 hypothetical protein [Chlorobi bacterium CHB7]MDL1886944.1 hypothetical protein [Ignavibacteria bacterium CHB1]MEB2328715.1 hypothetical protein [Ignavibacteriaceae bacterium]OQY79124.1 MAG: hypothetical protein B6D4
MKISPLYLIITFLLSALIYGCEDNIIPGLQEKLIKADKITIYFFDEGTNTVSDPDKIVTIEQKQDINTLINSISGESSPEYKCGYNGSIEFFNDNKSIFVTEFNFENDCAHFVFRYNKEMFSKKMEESGIRLLKEYFSRTHKKG